MRKFIQNKLKEQKGLTLIELLAVIVILAIIAAIAIPAIGNIIENSRVGAIKSDALNAIAASDLYYADNPELTTAVTISTLAGTNGYLKDAASFEGDTGSITKDGLISATGEVGNMRVVFTSASKEQISNYTNNSRTPASGVSATKP